MYDNLHVLVAGDIMLDVWREADFCKLSPEAPVPDIHNPKTTYTLGGAGNVARIIRELGANVYLTGVIGADRFNTIEDLCSVAGNAEQAALARINIEADLFTDSRRTTIKERIICQGQQLLRISCEDTFPIDDELAKDIFEVTLAPVLDGIIIADYSKGVMTSCLKKSIIGDAVASEIPVLVDPKGNFKDYGGCTIFKPNEREMTRWMSSWKDEEWGDLCEWIGCEYLVVTSASGMRWGDEQYISSRKVDVANVSGAGDAAAAVMLCEYIASGDIKLAVEMANYASSQIVSTERTGHLDIQRLEDFRGSCDVK